LAGPYVVVAVVAPVGAAGAAAAGAGAGAAGAGAAGAGAAGAGASGLFGLKNSLTVSKNPFLCFLLY